MQKSKEAGFSFKINVGDILIHLMAKTETERIKYKIYDYKLDGVRH